MPTKKKTPERYVDILKISKRYLVLLGYPISRAKIFELLEKKS